MLIGNRLGIHDFGDVTPIPQDDGLNPVVPIAYPQEYVALMDLLRALIAANETTKRALDLTTAVIEHSASHYTAWHFRRRCLFAVGADLRAELTFVEEVAGENPKNYQIWYHRRAVALRMGGPGDELGYVGRVTAEDPKNYHAWSHRQWVVQ
ncbi:unnamed protein product, partial [Discosporangium mesarthrocarpum]